MTDKETTTEKRPDTEEKTKGQTGGMVGSSMFGGLLGTRSRGTYRIYRRMRRNPTIALGRIAATAPIRAAPWAVGAKDDAPEGAREFIHDQFDARWSQLMKDVLFALDYGWSPFEKVFDFDTDGRLVYRKLKPLLVDHTDIQIDKDTGAFAGLKQGKIILGPEKCFLFSNEAEAGELHGRSRHENCRFAWDKWKDTATQAGKYGAKVAGIIPIIEYPGGVSEDAAGAEVSNFELAQRVLDKLGSGHGIAMPNALAAYAEELFRRGIDPKQMRAWVIEFLEPKAAHGADFILMLRYWDTLCLRGWIVPERSAIEGQEGTKAEAETHGDLGVSLAELVFLDILRHYNWYLIDPLLVLNWGEKARGSVYLTTPGLSDEDRAFWRKMFADTLKNPQNIDLLLKWIDIDAALDHAKLPKAQETIGDTKLGRDEDEDKASGFLSRIGQWWRR